MWVAEVRHRRQWGDRVWGGRVWVPLESTLYTDAVMEARGKASSVDFMIRFSFWPSPLEAVPARWRLWSFVEGQRAAPASPWMEVGGGGLVVSYAPVGLPPTPEVAWMVKVSPRERLQGGAVRREAWHVGPFSTLTPWEQAVETGAQGMVMGSVEYLLHSAVVLSLEWSEVIGLVRLSDSSVWTASLQTTRVITTLNSRRVGV